MELKSIAASPKQQALFSEFNDKQSTPSSHLLFTLHSSSPTTTTNNTSTTSPSSLSAASSSTNNNSLSSKKEKKSMKKKQSDQMFMNQSVIYNHEGKKQRNKTIYSINHPKVLHDQQVSNSNFQFHIGQEVQVNVCECKSEKKTDHFDKIIIEHLGYTNQHNMDASKTIAIEFVNVLAFKRRRNDSKILWIYESVVLDQLLNQGHKKIDNDNTSQLSSSPITQLKRKLDSMSEESSSSDDIMDQSTSLMNSPPLPPLSKEEEEDFENCFLVAANPFIDSSSSLHTLSNHSNNNTSLEEQTKKSKLDTYYNDHIESGLFMESIEPEDAPSKKPTLFQLSLKMNIEQPFHLFNPMMKHFCLDFVSTLSDDQQHQQQQIISFDASIISVQPVFSTTTSFNSTTLKGSEFQLIGKTPLITMYDSVNTFVRLRVDSEIFVCKNANQEKLFFYFYGEDTRMKSEQLIQNPNIATNNNSSSIAMETSNSSTPSNSRKDNNNYSDLILFEFGSEDHFFEQFNNKLNVTNNTLNSNKKSSRNLLFDRYEELLSNYHHNNNSINKGQTIMNEKFDSYHQEEEVIKLLVHIQDALGFTLLMHFAARNMIEQVKCCLEWGANIFQHDSLGCNALFWSQYFKANEVSELLLETMSQKNQYTGDKSDEIAFQQQLRHGLVDASSRLEKRYCHQHTNNSTTTTFSTSESEEE